MACTSRRPEWVKTALGWVSTLRVACQAFQSATIRTQGLGFNFFGFGVTGFGFRAGASEPSFVALLSRGLCGIPLIGKRGVWNVGLDGRS